MSKALMIIGVACIAIVAFLTLRMTNTGSDMSTMPTISQNGMTQTQSKSVSLESWKSFTDPNNKFKVSMPSLPQSAAQRLNDPKTKVPRQYTIYLGEEGNGNLFMVSLITMLDSSESKKINEAVMSNVITDLLSKNPDSKVKKMELGNYQGFPAMDFSIESNQVNIDGKAFLVRNTLYVLTYAAQPNNYSPIEFNYFINSFQLMQNGTEKTQ